MKNYILSVILACAALAVQAQTSTGIHHIKYLEINTGNSDYSVDFIDQDKVLFATATTNKVINSRKHQAHLDLFEGEMSDEGQILNKSRAKGFATKRVTKTGATFSSDKKTVYYSAKRYSKRKSKKVAKSTLFKADIDENGDWTNIVTLPFNKKNYTIENPTLNKEDTKLYFSSDLPGTVGGKDLFVVNINEDGTYSEPKNLGEKVNTYKDEITPFIADNNFLYFSSNGRDDSMGSFDIYTSEPFENTVSEPLHLDAPINSINDDFAYIVRSDKGYFSSNRLQGQDNNDIYSFYIEPDKPKECLQEIVGTVRDKDTELVLAEANISIVNDQGTEIETLTTDANGSYSFKLACGSTYTVRATKKQYSKEEHIVNTANYDTAPILEINQGLTSEFKIAKNNKVTININPIYFGFDKHNITNEAKAELDRIVKVMKANPEITVESASHTDARGPRAYNQKLSERRADATVAYIVSHGIDKSRINAKGYGESQLLNKCANGVRCTNDQHQYNRRTEFVIINNQASLNLENHSNREEETAVASENKDANPVKENITEAVDTTNLSDESSEKMEDENVDESTKTTTEETNNDTSSEGEIKVISYTTAQKKFSEDNIVNAAGLTNRPITDVEEKQDEQEVAQQTVMNTNIIVVDNNESGDFVNAETKKSTTENKLLNNKNKVKAPLLKDSKQKKVKRSERVPDIVNKTSSPTIMSQSQNNTITNYEKEEASQDASSLFNAQPKNTALKNSNVNSDSNTSIELKNSITNNNKLTEKESTNTTLAESLKQTDIDKKTTLNNNNTRIATTLVEEETDNSNTTATPDYLLEDGDSDAIDPKNMFSRDFTEEIVVTDYETKPKKEESRVIIAKQKKKFEKEYISSTKGLKKEEVLSINSIDVSPILIKNNGKYTVTDKSTKVDVMRINFQVDNNKYIKPGYKEVFILIQNPKGTILNRKGTFEGKNGKKLIYTEKTNAYYRNNFLNISMVTDRFIQRITKGIYTVIIYIEGYPVGLEMVELS